MWLATLIGLFSVACSSSWGPRNRARIIALANFLGKELFDFVSPTHTAAGINSISSTKTTCSLNTWNLRYQHTLGPRNGGVRVITAPTQFRGSSWTQCCNERRTVHSHIISMVQSASWVVKTLTNPFCMEQHYLTALCSLCVLTQERTVLPFGVMGCNTSLVPRQCGNEATHTIICTTLLPPK